MSQTLWDTSGSEVLSALLAERRSAGALASGLALSFVVVVDEKRVGEAELAATAAAAAHPCRLLIVVRRSIDSDSRLDAEVQVGGRLGPTEAVVLRTWGRLALHAESVVLPLLAPDAPVVTWWHGPPPEDISTDALGVFANRRITDSVQADDPLASLQHRATDFVPGDTDLAWTRTTAWRSVIASALDSVPLQPQSATISAAANDPSASLICGWLGSKLGIGATVDKGSGAGVSRVQIDGQVDGGDYSLSIARQDDRSATLARTGEGDRQLPLAQRGLGDLLAEELRRMEPDLVYAESLAAATAVEVDQTLRSRTHRWEDPVWRREQQESAEPGEPAESDQPATAGS
jgi:glucose-6-phosphate dehydrogenase assembly protein OpcA